jgi:hypothetical protein
MNRPLYRLLINGIDNICSFDLREVKKLRAEHRRYQNLGVKLGYFRHGPAEVKIINDLTGREVR